MLGSKTEKAAGNQRKTKDKIIPLHDMKAYRGRRDITPFIHNLCTAWR
jgi:hypothetical protein